MSCATAGSCRGGRGHSGRGLAQIVALRHEVAGQRAERKSASQGKRVPSDKVISSRTSLCIDADVRGFCQSLPREEDSGRGLAQIVALRHEVAGQRAERKSASQAVSHEYEIK
jgi:hypothetical protein